MATTCPRTSTRPIRVANNKTFQTTKLSLKPRPQIFFKMEMNFLLWILFTTSPTFYPFRFTTFRLFFPLLPNVPLPFPVPLPALRLRNINPISPFFFRFLLFQSFLLPLFPLPPPVPLQPVLRAPIFQCSPLPLHSEHKQLPYLFD